MSHTAARPSLPRPDLVDPRLLAPLANLELLARGVVEGFLIGLHRAPGRGFSQEFAENRPYNAGDAIRFVDWKVFARSDRLFIRQYDAETNLRSYLLLDISRSMDWTSDPARFVSKLDYARLLAASLALLLVRQGDAVGLLAFDDCTRAHLPPRATEAYSRRLLDALAQAKAGEGTEAASALRDLSGRLRRRGLVILLSDLLVDPPATRRALRLLRHRGHEVLIFHLMDPGERELPSAGEALFFDPETGEELAANSGALRREYRDAVESAIDEWRREALSIGADYTLLTTDSPLGLALARCLHARGRSRAR